MPEHRSAAQLLGRFDLVDGRRDIDRRIHRQGSDLGQSNPSLFNMLRFGKASAARHSATMGSLVRLPGGGTGLRDCARM
jgi:hypothetical protein